MRTETNFYDVTAVFENGEVDCSDDSIKAAILIAVQDVPASPSYPDMDYQRATVACDTLDGKITNYDSPSKPAKALVY